MCDRLSREIEKKNQVAIICPNHHFNDTKDTAFYGKWTRPFLFFDDIPISQTRTFQTLIKGLPEDSTFVDRHQISQELGRWPLRHVFHISNTKIRQSVEHFGDQLRLVQKARVEYVPIGVLKSVISISGNAGVSLFQFIKPNIVPAKREESGVNFISESQAPIKSGPIHTTNRSMESFKSKPIFLETHLKRLEEGYGSHGN